MYDDDTIYVLFVLFIANEIFPPFLDVTDI